MKKVIAIGLSLLVSLTGCSSMGIKESYENDVTEEAMIYPNDNQEDTSSIEKAPVQDDMESDGKESNFRGNCWGDSIENVKDNEDLEFLGGDDTGLMYTGYKLSNIGTDVVYYFDSEDGLYMGGYSITETHSNTNAYVDDYYKLQKLLKDKYGEGEEYVRWLSDFYEKTPEYYGAAISTGDLALNTEWNMGDTQILLSLYGDNYISKTTIMYIDQSYDVEEDTSGL